MRLLVLGGTRFVGRMLVDEARRRGHEVTAFNRGRTGTDVPGVEVVRGDREAPGDVRRLRSSGPWDAVIDTSGYIPGVVGDNARELAPRTARYVFLSTVSVYADWPQAGVSEESPLQECSPDIRDSAAGQGSWPPGRYGAYKAGCERAVRDVFDGRALILRPSVILGPWEDVGRLPWWLRRIARGGWVLAPGDPERVMQPVDVRDLVTFVLDCIGSDTVGVFNVAGARDDATWGTFIDSCRLATGSDAEPVWVDEDFLLAQGVRQWTELPLWRTHAGTWDMATDRASAAGLTCRSMRDTARATWDWLTTGDGPAHSPRAARHGLDAGKERRILDAWAVRLG